MKKINIILLLTGLLGFSTCQKQQATGQITIVSTANVRGQFDPCG